MKHSTLALLIYAAVEAGEDATALGQELRDLAGGGYDEVRRIGDWLYAVQEATERHPEDGR